MMKEFTKSLQQNRFYDDFYDKPYFLLTKWYDIYKWPTEIRYLRYDRFLDFVATVCCHDVPTRAEKGRYVS